MPHVVALYRHPVKGFTPEKLPALTVQADGRIAGDRVLAFRFADATMPDDRDGLDYWPKSKGLALESFPSLSVLSVSYDDGARRVRIERDGFLLVDARIDEKGRADLVEAITEFVLASPEARYLNRPGRMPLSLVGDGETSRFQDRPRGYVSVHSRASVGALGEALGADIDDRRFRSNVVIDGADAWEELTWSGRAAIGDVEFTVDDPIVRCLATHAHPDLGIRDAPVLTTLTGALGQARPSLGRLLLLRGVSGDVSDRSGEGGVIRVGDEVRVLPDTG